MTAKNTLSYFLSIVGHPMLVIMYMLFFYLKANPYLFPYRDKRDLMTIVLIIFVTSVILPGISILLLRGVGFIKTLEMQDRQERIGPLIVVMVCYLWLYLNIRTNNMIPIPFATFVLGALIAIFFSFAINVFSKISLHGVGMGGLIVGLLYLLTNHGGTYLNFSLFGGVYQMHAILLIALVLIMSGLVLTSRLYLKAHIPQEIYGGLCVGILGQMIALAFF